MSLVKNVKHNAIYMGSNDTKSKVKKWKCSKIQKRKPIGWEKSKSSRPKLYLRNLKWSGVVSLTTLTKVISLKKNTGHEFKDVNEIMKHYWGDFCNSPIFH
jgi:hypothetical protein